MTRIIVGEKVISRSGKRGKIIWVDGDCIMVMYAKWEMGKFILSAFEKGYLRYKKPDLQRAVEREMQYLKLFL